MIKGVIYENEFNLKKEAQTIAQELSWLMDNKEEITKNLSQQMPPNADEYMTTCTLDMLFYDKDMNKKVMLIPTSAIDENLQEVLSKVDIAEDTTNAFIKTRCEKFRQEVKCENPISVPVAIQIKKVV